LRQQPRTAPRPSGMGWSRRSGRSTRCSCPASTTPPRPSCRSRRWSEAPLRRRTRDDVRVPDSDAMRLAVLIDSDNTTASFTTELLEEIAKYGTPTIKRAYGDWTTPQLAGWKEELLRHAIQPVQQFSYTRGK